MSFITHLKSFTNFNYQPITNIDIISDYNTKRYCAVVFTWIGINFFNKEILFPNPEEIDDIPLVCNIFLPTHSQHAACWLYVNKNPINNNLIYCERDLLPFIKNYISLNNNHILVISGGDPNLLEKDVSHLNFKYCVSSNLLIKDNKYIPLPCGFRGWSIDEINYLKQYMSTNCIKNKNIFIKFSMTNPEREKIINICKKLNLYIDDNNALNVKEFHNELKSHFFTVSPESSGIDSSRTWEALYEQSIPIVKKSVLTEFYKDIFPMIVLDDWEELSSYKFDYNLYYGILSQYPNYLYYLDARNLWSYILQQMEI